MDVIAQASHEVFQAEGIGLMSAITARDVLSGMKINFDAEAAKGVSGTVVYELTGEGGGTWTVRVEQGTLEVDETMPSSAPGATVSLSADDFVRVATGELNAMQGFMSGKIKITGDPFLAQKIQGLFRKPE